MIVDIEKEAQFRMQQTADHACEDLLAIRTGRAHPTMFNRLNADYYEAPVSLQQSATFNSPDLRTVLITPFDRSTIAAIKKVIREADLGVSPSSNGSPIRVVMPQLTEERRREYIKLARAKAEDARITVRNVHRHSIDALKKFKKKSKISRDELTRAEKTIDVTTREYVEAIDGLLKSKEAGLSKVWYPTRGQPGRCRRRRPAGIS